MSQGHPGNTMGSFVSRAIGDRYVSIAQLAQSGRSLVPAGYEYREIGFEAKAKHLENIVGPDTGLDMRALGPGNLAWTCTSLEHHVMWLGGGPTLRLRMFGRPLRPNAAFDMLVLCSARQLPSSSPKVPR